MKYAGSGWPPRPHAVAGGPEAVDVGDLHPNADYLIGAVVSRWTLHTISNINDDAFPLLQWASGQALRDVVPGIDYFGAIAYISERVATLSQPVAANPMATAAELMTWYGAEVLAGQAGTLQAWAESQGVLPLIYHQVRLLSYLEPHSKFNDRKYFQVVYVLFKTCLGACGGGRGGIHLGVERSRNHN